MTSDFLDFANGYLVDLKRTIDELPMGDLHALYSKVLLVASNDSTVHFIGNGGSAATPSHSAGDWSKELGLKTISHCLLYTSPSPRD